MDLRNTGIEHARTLKKTLVYVLDSERDELHPDPEEEEVDDGDGQPEDKPRAEVHWRLSQTMLLPHAATDTASHYNRPPLSTDTVK